jgi:hypothetical protein
MTWQELIGIGIGSKAGLAHPTLPIRLTETQPESSHTMHDALRQRLIRKIESLPDEQIYQILDYIEFLES